jgi:DNA-binding transcriptional regulator WhiA
MGKTTKTVQWKLDKMVEYYQTGLSAYASAKQVGSSSKVCLKELKRRDIKARSLSSYTKTPQHILDKIVKNYLNGMTIEQSVKGFNITHSVCQQELKKRNIPARKSGTYQSPSKENKDIMIQNYINGMTSHEAGSSIGVSFTTCLKELKRRSIPAKSENFYRQLPINEDYFETIDTEEKAYWLGFITADGSLYEKKHQLHFTLKLSDKHHLEKFLHNIECPKRIQEYHTNNGHWVCKVTIQNKKIYSDLKKYGLHQKKSFTVKPYSFNSIEFDRAYWRGIIDGDGSILRVKAKTAKNGHHYQIGLVGNEFIIEGFRAFLYNNELPINTIISKNGRIFQTRFSSKEVVKDITNLLYKNASIYLDRKYQTYLTMCMQI